MFVNAKSPTFAYAGIENVLNSMNSNPGQSGTWDDLFVDLFIEGPSPLTPAMQYSDFTLPNFLGYAQYAVSVVNPAVNTPNGLGQCLVATAEFIGAGPGFTNPCNCKGYLISDSNGIFIAAEYFEAPIPITERYDFVFIQILLGFTFNNQLA
jgi:hypothetical protein